VRSFDTALQPLADVQALKVEGLINSFASAQSFSVGGRPVDASGASFPDGTSSLAIGVRVKVEGTVRSGVLRASQVSIQSDQQVRDQGFEIIGALTAVNPSQRTITLRGFTIGTARPDLRFEDGSAADLVVGRTVEVKGVLSGDQRTFDATRIRIR
jgi:primosomal replication protein N